MEKSKRKIVITHFDGDQIYAQVLDGEGMINCSAALDFILLYYCNSRHDVINYKEVLEYYLLHR